MDEERINDLAREWAKLDDKKDSARKKKLYIAMLQELAEVIYGEDSFARKIVSDSKGFDEKIREIVNDEQEHRGEADYDIENYDAFNLQLSGEDDVSDGEWLLKGEKKCRRGNYNNGKDYEDIIWDALNETMDKYDPEKGKFMHYFRRILKFRKLDAIKPNKRITSYYRKDDSGNEVMLDIPDQDNTLPIIDRETFLTKMNELLSMIILFADHHAGRKNNPVRREWYRIFFTEDITLSLQEFPQIKQFKHERDVFTAMKISYLDYYMTKKCRTVQDISYTNIKPYNEIVEGAEKMETPLPLPADVSINYYCRVENKKMTRSNRSNYYTAYYEEKKKLGE